MLKGRELNYILDVSGTCRIAPLRVLAPPSGHTHHLLVGTLADQDGLWCRGSSLDHSLVKPFLTFGCL